MKIDWKYLASTPGYKSLKAAYIHDVQEANKRKIKFGSANRGKEEFLKKFNWIINRAKHHAIRRDIPIWDVLDTWEKGRTYWWLNYYQDCNQSRCHSSSHEKMGVTGARKYYKTSCGYGSQTVKHQVSNFIRRAQEKESTKEPKRWTPHKKESQRKYKKYL